jgi:putative addiction module component (TIGR02574 family)
MKRNAAEILREATALSAEDRAALAESWIVSLDGHVDDDAATAWATEIDRRVGEVDAGTVATIPWPEVRRRCFERTRRRALNRLRDGFDLKWVSSGSRENLRLLRSSTMLLAISIPVRNHFRLDRASKPASIRRSCVFTRPV